MYYTRVKRDRKIVFKTMPGLAAQSIEDRVDELREIAYANEKALSTGELNAALQAVGGDVGRACEYLGLPSLEAIQEAEKILNNLMTPQTQEVDLSV